MRFLQLKARESFHCLNSVEEGFSATAFHSAVCRSMKDRQPYNSTAHPSALYCVASFMGPLPTRCENLHHKLEMIAVSGSRNSPICTPLNRKMQPKKTGMQACYNS